MAHTKEPWRSHSSVVTLNNQGGFDLRGAPNAEENAARIVACVNACAGIPIEKLTQVENSPAPIFDLLLQTAKQRDELLVALKSAREFIVNGIEVGAIKMPDADTPDPALLTLPAIEAAIAKAEA